MYIKHSQQEPNATGNNYDTGMVEDHFHCPSARRLNHKFMNLF